MAEFCLDCWNKMNRTRLKETDVILSDHMDLCEECERVKPVIDGFKNHDEGVLSKACQWLAQWVQHDDADGGGV